MAQKIWHEPKNYAYLILVLVLIPTSLSADWVKYYSRDCKRVNYNQVCRQRLSVDLGKMRSYRFMVDYYLDQHRLPSWLKYLPIIESRYRPKAVSRREKRILALGLWQISPANLKAFCKLTQGKNCDSLKRKYWQDPEVSTQAACWILSGLINKFGDWELALKAYNAGSRRVNEWIDGGELPDETVQYTKQLVAIQKLAKTIKPVKHRVKYLEYIIK